SSSHWCPSPDNQSGWRWIASSNQFDSQSTSAVYNEFFNGISPDRKCQNLAACARSAHFAATI
ncbi:hypothetical protein AAFO92_22355, partial [Roseovarius sp. CAU 1744]|uniref:hypothetical protein n=1 Tax=Roseovarius sp. CAU 1744 TaxID=3140368 RepID=UPI00325BC0EC